ncbi:MAG: FkbM family methyltransferase [Gammaproteobacteria bacterium]|nr:MAG: FkbM family methyltransferase [Gammaproteobacteria bacterium]
METAMRNISSKYRTINSVIDIGASNGSWSLSLKNHLPNCKYLLIEAQEFHKKALHKTCEIHENFQYILAAAGKSKGKIYFNAEDPLGGQASYTPYESHNIEVDVTSIDSEVQSKNLKGPFLLKFDTHGFEVPILEGANKTLEQTEVIVMECYNFNIAPECLLFYEMCAYLNEIGFRCVDLVDPLHRPIDNAFWQMDLIFIKNDSTVFSSLTYD